MLRLLARLLIRDSQNTSDPRVREQYGTLASIVGIVLNLILFAGKALIGLATGSIAATADALNNLSDAGSSIITMVRQARRRRAPVRPWPRGIHIGPDRGDDHRGDGL